MNKLFDEYGRKARLFPALLCSLPFLLIKHSVIDRYLGVSFTHEFFTVLFGDITFTAILVYLLSQINRLISKLVFEKKSEFPTVHMLLPSGTSLSADYKAKIALKVKNDFHILLPTDQEEQQNLNAAKTKIGEIVSLIIHKVGSGRLLLQHNIEYGFMRNLIGGSLLAVIISAVCAIVFKYAIPDATAFIVAIVLAGCYCIPIIFSKIILNNYSLEYARILFREYLGQ